MDAYDVVSDLAVDGKGIPRYKLKCMVKEGTSWIKKVVLSLRKMGFCTTVHFLLVTKAEKSTTYFLLLYRCLVF
ncbi:hypothetical protein L1987_14135 [Smallanthus sonchifolius]|uniref:Uncharacterized protein n=1 Tax=Smallanthus sonchifolius TaxID=185202 RepID=A0ACB9J3Y9_9ASTR|nr:hypothetical protein L1987_14135 [Smallanthus sonchifolius]